MSGAIRARLRPVAATAEELDLAAHGIDVRGRVFRNPATPVLYEHAVLRGEARIGEGGPFVVDTGMHTGRSPKDKYAVREPESEGRIWWASAGGVNHELPVERYESLRAKTADHLARLETLYVVDAFAGAHPAHRLAVRVVTQTPYHALFSATMLIRPTERELARFEPDVLVLHAPAFEADPAEDGTRTGTFSVFHPTRREILIGGTHYAGEIKKGVFTLLNDVLPLDGVFPMHCSANVGEAGDVAIFFGLSGTGKTTLSADPARRLIGDDEHGWGDGGVFNLEGGCYAKTINLSPEAEPEIYAACTTFGTVLENVAIDAEGRLDFGDGSKTENTRAAYELRRIANALPGGMAGHPRNVVFLAADAFAVLPPIARLDDRQARYYFLSGFTSIVAGTEIGATEPRPTFSACFGAPFLPQPPAVYARMLGEKLARHRPSVWLVNTGWTGGPAAPLGEGRRMPIQVTRALLHAALAGKLDRVGYRVDPTFGFEVPVRVPGVEDRLLDPRSTWRDAGAYDAQARALAAMFRANIERFPDAARELAGAGPLVS